MGLGRPDYGRLGRRLDVEQRLSRRIEVGEGRSRLLAADALSGTALAGLGLIRSGSGSDRWLTSSARRRERTDRGRIRRRWRRWRVGRVHGMDRIGPGREDSVGVAMSRCATNRPGSS
jgi:hypothetical protein